MEGLQISSIPFVLIIPCLDVSIYCMIVSFLNLVCVAYTADYCFRVYILKSGFFVGLVCSGYFGKYEMFMLKGDARHRTIRMFELLCINVIEL